MNEWVMPLAEAAETATTEAAKVRTPATSDTPVEVELENGERIPKKYRRRAAAS
jgi:hypothetical protein